MTMGIRANQHRNGAEAGHLTDEDSRTFYRDVIAHALAQEHSPCPLLRFRANFAAAWAGLSSNAIDADSLTRTRLRDEGPIRLLHHQRDPSVVVASFPDGERATFWLESGSRTARTATDPLYSSAGVTTST